MVERNPDFISHLRTLNDNLAEKLRNLCQRSEELQECSRALKEKSEEINQRIRSCVNSKRAA